MAEPHPEHLQAQSSTAVTHCLLIATNFTDPEWTVARDVRLRVPRPGVEPGPLASKASVLQLSQLLS